MSQVPAITEEFLEECNHALVFLVTEHAFKGPEVDDLFPQTVHVNYRKGEIEIECSLDIRDEMVSVYLVRLSSGRKPTAWKVNERGEVVRAHLLSVLIHRGVREFMAKDIPGVADLSERQGSFRTALVSKARLLKKYGQDILAGSAAIFDGYSEESGRF